MTVRIQGEEVAAYLHAHWKEVAERLYGEVDALRIQTVGYWWPKRPTSGMIFFEGPDECRCWHCDINYGKLCGLVFDT